MRNPSATLQYIPDGRGSVIGVSDPNGLILGTYEYDPFGQVISSTVPAYNPFRFAGRRPPARSATFSALVRV